MTIKELRGLAARSGFRIETASGGTKASLAGQSYRIVEDDTGRRLLTRDGRELHRLGELFETLTERC